MATVASLVARLRTEIGDLGKSFVWQTTADGVTNRYEIPHAPVSGASLTVFVNGADVSDACAVEEETGVLTLDSLPEAGHTIVVGGTVFRYFTDTTVTEFVDTAFKEHSNTSSDLHGGRYTVGTLPAVEEYPVVVLASTMALQALATDAAFDIDIAAPDGVMIPRSQRYRQLMEMVEQRRAQYRDLCVNLNIGLYRIETFSVRRISMRTNRLAPIYRPQEIDDRSLPKRVRIPIPTFGTLPEESVVPTQDLYAYAGDEFSISLDFPIDLTGYNIDAQIRLDNGQFLRAFTIDVPDLVNGVVVLSLSSDETRGMPERAVWDIELTEIATSVNKTWMQGLFITERDITDPANPYASGWRG